MNILEDVINTFLIGDVDAKTIEHRIDNGICWSSTTKGFIFNSDAGLKHCTKQKLQNLNSNLDKPSRTLALNKDETLLLEVDRKTIYVSQWLTKNNEVLTLGFSSPIIKVKWHPLSAQHLVVLLPNQLILVQVKNGGLIQEDIYPLSYNNINNVVDFFIWPSKFKWLGSIFHYLFVFNRRSYGCTSRYAG